MRDGPLDIPISILPDTERINIFLFVFFVKEQKLFF